MSFLIYYPIKILSIFTLLQVPQGVPNPANSEPLSLDTPFDYILYIGMPLLILIGYFFWRRKRKEKVKEKEDEENKNL